MTSNSRVLRAVGLMLLAAALSGGCQHSDVYAPKDATITVTTDKSVLNFPANATAADTIDVHVFALLLTTDGFPQSGVAIRFSATSGDLASKGNVVTTDSSSIARDTLTVHGDAPNAIDITASSGTLSGKVTITKGGTGLAPSDGHIAATAAPTSVAIDGANGQTNQTSTITAVVTDKNGSPVPAVTVQFQTTAGTMNHTSVTTDTTGTATANLILGITDATSATVTTSANTPVQGSPLTGTATVTKSVSSAPSSAVPQVPTANPTSIVAGGSSQIQAAVTLSGVGIPGLTVQFTTTGGTLSATSAVTDDTGTATVNLTLSLSDPASVTVTASVTGLQSQTVVVTKS